MNGHFRYQQALVAPLAGGAATSLRVLHLGSPTGLYGAERWILALVRYLPDDIESMVGAIRDAPGGEPEICVRAAALGKRIVVFDAPGRLSGAAVGRLRSFIREQDVRILHTHGYKTDILGALAVRGTNCRIVSTPHGWSRNAGFKLRAYEALNRIAFLLHDAVVPLSPDIHQGLSRFPGLPRKLHLVPNGVDLAEVDAATARREVLSAERLDGGFLFGYIGQLIPRKGLTTLLHAFSRLEDTATRLCLIGEGGQRGELEQLALQLGVADRTRFLGYRADRLDLLKCFDAFVLPSTLEGIPRCILEAMAAGVPAIVSEIPGCTDVVRHGQTGLVFPVGNVTDLANRMADVVRLPAHAARMAGAAKQFVRERFSAEAMAAAYTRLYGEVVRAG